tara:strand:- start:10451 stop:11593 length:1143 start_codon:yes stop_codon:yes gene_type:complete
MNIPIHYQPSPWRYLWLLLLIGLPILGWHGVLDDFSSQDINHSITNAGLIYGTARGINALVSVLQGTEVNVLVMTFSIGEVLDPVNDLIERFSEFVLWALGSLALQKILLAIVSETMFNVLLSAAAAVAGVSLFVGNRRLLSATLRVFITIAFLRFSLGLVVIANSWVDTLFLDEADQQRHIAMENFQGDLRELDSLSRKEDEARALLTALQSERVKLEQQRNEVGRALDLLDAAVQAAEANLETLADQAGGLCKMSALSPTCPEVVKKAKDALKQLEFEQESTAASLTAIEDELQKSEDKMACLKKQQRGENCNFWDSLPDAPNPAVLKQKLNDINASLSSFADNCINLLVSLLLKTVVIPLLFMYLLLRIMRMSWTRV